MSYKINKPGWIKEAKSYRKTTKHLLTSAKTAIKNTNKAEQA
jgi:hypothetical protein